MCKQCTGSVTAFVPNRSPCNLDARRREVVSARRARIASRGDSRGTNVSRRRASERARATSTLTREGEIDASVIRIGAESRSIDARESAEERRASARGRRRDVRSIRASVGETR